MGKNKVLLQINVCNNIYSTGKIASDIGELAISRGWKSYIASTNEIRPSKNISIIVGRRLNILFHVLESRLFDNTGLGIASKMTTKRLIRQIIDLKPTVIHLHIIHGYYLNFPILFDYLSNCNIPVIWTIHSCWEVTGHCSFFDMVGCTKWKNGCNHCIQLKQYPKSYFRDNSINNYVQKKKIFNSIEDLTLVPVSKWLGGIISQSYLKEKKAQIIYNGIDTNIFKYRASSIVRTKYNISDCFIAIAVASTWEKRKNLKDYLLLAELVPKDYRIMLVGLNKEIINKLPPQIIGIEKTDNLEELVELYSTANVVLNFSLEESFGLTTVEGYACGTPSIVYNCTASPELVFDGTGYIVTPGDFDTIIGYLQTIKNNGKTYYLDRCRQVAIERFNKDKNFIEYIQLYEKLTENR